MIIDFHTHLGDIVAANGWEIIGQKGLTKENIYDPIESGENMHYKNIPLISGVIRSVLGKQIDQAEKARSATATLENMLTSMNDVGVTHSVCMPIAPNVNFNHIKDVCMKEQSLISFTSVDFSAPYAIEATLKNNVLNGAKGLKLHPIIQKTSFEDKKTMEALEAFSSHKLPVLFHCGAQWNRNQDKKFAQFALPENAVKMVEAFPDVDFIIGHAGVFQVKQVMSIFAKYKNTYVDTSFQPSSIIKKLIRVFGPERVLYASDWPFGSRKTNIATVTSACFSIKDPALSALIFYENAKRLLQLK